MRAGVLRASRDAGLLFDRVRRRSIERVDGVGTLSSPIKEMEDVSGGALPDLRAFLPLWVARLGRFRPADTEWDTPHERWLREAVFRADHDAASDAMRVAAEKRVDGILVNSRRRHYGHAALLVASCVASAPAGRERELAQWAADVRQQYRRRHAFREELTRAFARLGLAPLS